MMKVNHSKQQQNINRNTLFQSGFRPFFLLASLFSVISMIIWMADLIFSTTLMSNAILPVYWHAHEMIYAYTLAVIAGFLLTAVKNWTKIQTLHGWSLFVLVLLWVLTRIASLISGEQALLVNLILDNIFIGYLAISLTIPILKAKSWKNLAVVSNIYLFLTGQVIYSLGVLGILYDGQRIGIYIGLYIALSLILMLSRRLIPMFIERGVGYPITLKNYVWIDVSCFILFFLFSVTDVFFTTPILTAYLAGILCVLHAIRLWNWHTLGIWKKPLLWSLYVAYAWIVIAFSLKFIAFLAGIPASLVVHAFTVGGIGMMTLAMMSRISLGHTGRNITNPPKGIGIIFFILFISTVVRVLCPIISPQHYQLWIGLSQSLWSLSFILFVCLYAMILIRPRKDGRWG